jgi:hypothetical protein
VFTDDGIDGMSVCGTELYVLKWDRVCVFDVRSGAVLRVLTLTFMGSPLKAFAVRGGELYANRTEWDGTFYHRRVEVFDAHRGGCCVRAFKAGPLPSKRKRKKQRPFGDPVVSRGGDRLYLLDDQGHLSVHT